LDAKFNPSRQCPPAFLRSLEFAPAINLDLYFANSTFDPWFGFMSTHPPLLKRIRAVDPAFDGQFHHILSLPRPEVVEAAAYDQKYQETLHRAREEAEWLEEQE
jgi:hypothetical protein